MPDSSLNTHTHLEPHVSEQQANGDEAFVVTHPWIRHYEPGVPAHLEIPDQPLTWLLDCTATGAVWNGNQADVSGITIQNALQRAPGKLVDLDPQQQTVSQIWGMQVRAVSASGQMLLQGEFKPAAFINLWRRQKTGVPRDQQLAAA